MHHDAKTGLTMASASIYYFLLGCCGKEFDPSNELDLFWASRWVFYEFQLLERVIPKLASSTVVKPDRTQCGLSPLDSGCTILGHSNQ